MNKLLVKPSGFAVICMACLQMSFQEWLQIGLNVHVVKINLLQPGPVEKRESETNKSAGYTTQALRYTQGTHSYIRINGHSKVNMERGRIWRDRRTFGSRTKSWFSTSCLTLTRHSLFQQQAFDTEPSSDRNKGKSNCTRPFYWYVNLTSFGHQRLAPLCTFCLSIYMLWWAGRVHREHQNGEGEWKTSQGKRFIKSKTHTLHLKVVCLFVFFTLSSARRSHSTRTRSSRAAATTAALTVRTCTRTSTAATPFGWRVACGWSMRDPTIKATSTSSALGSTPIASSGWLSTIASSPAVPSRTWGSSSNRDTSFQVFFCVWF